METSLQQQRELERGQKATGKKANTGDGPDGGMSDLLDTDAEPPTPGECATAGEPDDVDFESAGWVTDGDEGGCNGTSTIAAPQQMAVAPGALTYAEYLIRGVPDGTPIGVTLYSLDDTEVLGSLQDIWSFGSTRTCIYVPFEAPGGVAGVNGVFVVGEQAEAVVDNPLTYR